MKFYRRMDKMIKNKHCFRLSEYYNFFLFQIVINIIMALIVKTPVMAVTMETVIHLVYVIKDVIQDLLDKDVTVSII